MKNKQILKLGDYVWSNQFQMTGIVIEDDIYYPVWDMTAIVVRLSSGQMTKGYSCGTNSPKTLEKIDKLFIKMPDDQGRTQWRKERSDTSHGKILEVYI